MTTNEPTWDLLVVGGGINGTGIAADAAGRGLSVLLCEKGDLASATSSASSKLVHGGLRYLEYFEFGLVRKALAEREVLLAKAPHLIHPLRFILPHMNMVRPAWMIQIGLFLYDHLAHHPRLPNSHGINLREDPAGASLDKALSKGFAYSDCWVDDARLVVCNAMAAAANGADIRTRTELVKARRSDGLWRAWFHDHTNNAEFTVRARALVNAAGPWVESLLHGPLALRDTEGVRLVKGSHIVVPRIYVGRHAYILQHTDRRVVFVMPFEGDFSLIGTTDVVLSGTPEDAAVEAEEIAYLCQVVNSYFKTPIRPYDVVWSYTGVRPLFDDEAEDPSAVTRDYVLDLDVRESEVPLLSVFGGKITTYRQLAEEALAELESYFPNMGAAWTEATPLPGGDVPNGDLEAFIKDLVARYPDLDSAMLASMAQRHGSLTTVILGEARQPMDMGQDFGAGLSAREVDYMIAHEWARTANDVLWRRSKAGIHMNSGQRAAVEGYIEAAMASAPDNR
jgi:glycerol-3-phosphate dehydrogenase